MPDYDFVGTDDPENIIANMLDNGEQARRVMQAFADLGFVVVPKEADNQERIERLLGQIFELKASLGALSALMQFDIDDKRLPTVTAMRREILAKARSLANGEH